MPPAPSGQLSLHVRRHTRYPSQSLARERRGNGEGIAPSEGEYDVTHEPFEEPSSSAPGLRGLSKRLIILPFSRRSISHDAIFFEALRPVL